ncbi:MAG: hypothetical protein JWO22_1937 [Frankiales bacterium]|nr:hypothetical protein [Frankiales bacterium]
MIGSVVPLVRLPLTIVEGIESIIEQAQHIVTRAAGIADRAEGIAGRAEPIADRIEKLLDRTEGIPDHIDQLITRSSGIADAVHAVVDDATQTLTSLKPAVDALAGIDPEVLANLVPEAVELLPALRSLEQLVPVVSQLGVQVDHLDQTIAALLGGIPGAARLLKRGETARPAR